jgi:flavin-binding protein dodecin
MASSKTGGGCDDGACLQALRNIRWFEVIGQRGYVDGDAVIHQVTLKIGFTLDD